MAYEPDGYRTTLSGAAQAATSPTALPTRTKAVTGREPSSSVDHGTWPTAGPFGKPGRRVGDTRSGSPSQQNGLFCTRSCSRADSRPAAHSGGSARGYQAGLRVVGRLAAAVTGQRTSNPPTVYLCIGALGGDCPHLPRGVRAQAQGKITPAGLAS